MKKYLSFVLAALLIVGALAGCGEQGNTPAPDNSSTPIRSRLTLLLPARNTKSCWNSDLTVTRK